MSSDVYVSADRFSSGLGGLLDDVLVQSNNQAQKAIRKGGKLGKDEVTKNAKELPLKNMGGKTMTKYTNGFSYKFTNNGEEFSVEIGNKSVPGLVHLLEKGHAKVGGGRVSGYEHVAPAADVTFEKTFEYVSEAIGKALQ